MAKHNYKKAVAGSKNPKTEFRVVRESPKATKINKTDIEKAVEKAIAINSR